MVEVFVCAPNGSLVKGIGDDDDDDGEDDDDDDYDDDDDDDDDDGDDDVDHDDDYWGLELVDFAELLQHSNDFKNDLFFSVPPW